MRVKIIVNQRNGASSKHSGLFEHPVDVADGEEGMAQLGHMLATNRRLGTMVTLNDGDDRVMFWPEDVVRVETIK